MSGINFDVVGLICQCFQIPQAPQNALSGPPRTGRMEETNNRALQLLDRLTDKPGVNIEAFKRVADICDEERFHSEEY